MFTRVGACLLDTRAGRDEQRRRGLALREELWREEAEWAQLVAMILHTETGRRCQRAAHHASQEGESLSISLYLSISLSFSLVSSTVISEFTYIPSAEAGGNLVDRLEDLQLLGVEVDRFGVHQHQDDVCGRRGLLHRRVEIVLQREK